jgi:hypothetical protein
MSAEVSTHFVKQFTQGIRILQQQMGSRLREAVMVESDIVGDREFFDQMDATEMTEITNRHGDTEYTDTPHRRRMVTFRPYEVADLIDRADKVRVLNDPTNGYTRSFGFAAGRKIDDIIIDAFFATAATGVDGTGTAAFPAANQVTSAANMTLTDLRDAREILEAYENEEDDGDFKWYICMGASQRMSLLATTEVGSQDFNSVKALVNGQIDTFMGFKFLKSERLPVASSVRSCPVWVKRSMQLAMAADPRGFIDILPGKRHSTQVRYEFDGGATRMDEKGVVEILCTEP